jgi:phosphoribosyl 1,2-cyclic phosphodiesterase
MMRETDEGMMEGEVHAWFATLGSGSSGNAAYVEAAGRGLMVDCGLEAGDLTQRLRCLGRSWNFVQSVVLTHVHSDHWHETVLAELLVRRIPLWLHRYHIVALRSRSEYLWLLERNQLLREYHAGRWFMPVVGCRMLPIEVPHDSRPTFAFRVAVLRQQEAVAWLGYAADFGSASPALVEALTNVDLLAVEFNHDVQLQRSSGRPWYLIRRVLSDQGHLSNGQAAELVEQVLERSRRLPRYLVQLHLSEDCNRPELAIQSVRPVIERYCPSARLITAPRHEPSGMLPLVFDPSHDGPVL